MEYFIKINDEFTITGITPREKEEQIFSIEENWFPTSKEVFDFVLANNGMYRIKSTLQKTTETVVTLDDLELITRNLKEEKIHKKEKLKKDCQLFIDSGIYYKDIYLFTYKLEDQTTFAEMDMMIKSGIVKDIVEIRPSGMDTYIELTIEEFQELYLKLVNRKMYCLSHLRDLFVLVDNCQTKEQINGINFETNFKGEI